MSAPFHVDLNTSFEDYSTLLTQWDSETRGSFRNLSCSTNYAYDGSKSLYFYWDGTTTAPAGCYLDYYFIYKYNKWSMSFYFLMPAASTSSTYIYRANWCDWEVNLRYQTATDTIEWYSYTSGIVWSIPRDSSWHRVDLSVDNVEATYSLSIDSTPIFTDTPFEWGYTYHDSESIYFGTSTAGVKQDWYMDLFVWNDGDDAATSYLQDFSAEGWEKQFAASAAYGETPDRILDGADYILRNSDRYDWMDKQWETQGDFVVEFKYRMPTVEARDGTLFNLTAIQDTGDNPWYDEWRQIIEIWFDYSEDTLNIRSDFGELSTYTWARPTDWQTLTVHFSHSSATLYLYIDGMLVESYVVPWEDVVTNLWYETTWGGGWYSWYYSAFFDLDYIAVESSWPEPRTTIGLGAIDVSFPSSIEMGVENSLTEYDLVASGRNVTTRDSYYRSYKLSWEEMSYSNALAFISAQEQAQPIDVAVDTGNALPAFSGFITDLSIKTLSDVPGRYKIDLSIETDKL